MKKILIIIVLVFCSLFTHAQKNSGYIKLNGKTLLIFNKEDEKANIRKIKPAEWSKSGYLEIKYIEPDPDFWYRSFLFYDEEDNQLFVRDSTSKTKIPITQLRKLFAGKKEVRIYLGGAPRDPNIAVRMRRIHLCTLQFR